jgi:Zn-dependent peptidase ImmA (M78 family)
MSISADTGEHQSIAALLAAHPGERDTKKLIRQLARKKVDFAKSKGWSGPPFCPKQLASIFGIRCKEVGHDIDGDGRILLGRNGKLLIEYRSGRLPERQRFTIFHEFAHTLFPDFCKFLPCHQTAKVDVSSAEKRFEYLCDLAAAEMLLPLEEFNKDLEGVKWLGFETINKLRKRYEASIDATVYRMMDTVKTVPCAAVFLTDQKGKHGGHGPLWVNNVAANSFFKGFIKPGTLPPKTSVAIHCYQNGVETTEPFKETWWINGNPRTWLVQAAKLPTIPENPHYAKVVVLLFPSGYRKN